jgi:hypothetical protein
MANVTGLDDIYDRFETFRGILIDISAAANTIERSNDRANHEIQTDRIRNLVKKCESALLNMLESSRKYQRNEEYRPIFKLAVDYWCYEHDGKDGIDRMKKEMQEIKERLEGIKFAFTTIHT